MENSLKEQIVEFLDASKRLYSYNPLQNSYIWFGLLWGLPIPLTGILFAAACSDVHGLSQLLHLALTTSTQRSFLLTPLVFAALFGILGSIRHHKDEEVKNLIMELQRVSNIDPLTGLSNRRFFAKKFEQELARRDRNSGDMALIFLDLDHFKRINDDHGHATGDEALRLTAAHLRSHCRPYDLPARWGGEEFIILLPEADEATACRVAERIRRDFTSALSSTLPIKVTVSLGVTAYRHDDTLESLLNRADKALYHAKTTGRNRVVSWSAFAGNQHEQPGGPSRGNGSEVEKK